MAVLDQITGLIPVAIGAGIVLKVTEKALPQNGCATPGRRIRSGGMGRGLARGRGRGPIGRSYKRSRSPLGFGDFSNVGL